MNSWGSGYRPIDVPLEVCRACGSNRILIDTTSHVGPIVTWSAYAHCLDCALRTTKLIDMNIRSKSFYTQYLNLDCTSEKEVVLFTCTLWNEEQLNQGDVNND